MARGWRLTFAVGAVLVVVGAGWWLWLAVFADSSTSSFRETRAAVASPTPIEVLAAPTDAAKTPAGSAPSSVPPVGPVGSLLIDSDLGTGSSEFSAVTRNRDTNRLVVADDAGWLFEFDLGPGGEPLLPARRTIAVRVGAGDIEGVAWMSGTTYVLAHENDGRLTVVDISDSATSIDAAQLVRTIDTGIREEDGSGLEGVAYMRGDAEIEFVVVDEKPPTVYLINREGRATEVQLDLDVPDLSDIWADERNLYLLSDEGRVVVAVEISALQENGAEISRVTLSFDDGRFEQPEGLVGDGRGGLYIVGENPGPGRFSFGLLPAQ